MQEINSIFEISQRATSKTLQTFVKNLGNCSCIALPTAIHGLVDAPRCVIIFVKGITINCKRYLARHAEIVHKYSSNCGFQDDV